jgi:hypothetical protein
MLAYHARLCERIHYDMARYRRRQRLLDSLPSHHTTININNNNNNNKENGNVGGKDGNDDTMKLYDRYRALSAPCNNLKIQVGSLMNMITTYRNGIHSLSDYTCHSLLLLMLNIYHDLDRQDISQLRKILNRYVIHCTFFVITLHSIALSCHNVTEC